MRWVGAITVFICCGYLGFSKAANHKRAERDLRQILSAINYMECEIQYRLTPLPQLLGQAAKEISGVVGKVFAALANELENQISPDVTCCMETVLRRQMNIQEHTKEVLSVLGRCLGRFDLQGQLKELESVRGMCVRHLMTLETDRNTRLRSYQTLGLCAGSALAILLL